MVEITDGDGQRQHHCKAGINRAGHEIRRENRGMPASQLDHREVEANHGVDRNDQRRGQKRDQCTAEFLHPSDNTPKITLETLFVDLSRSVARSGTSPTNQKSKETVAYVETAKTSQTSGLLNCGHSHIGFGYGISQKNSHGRPMCSSGNIPAQATANSVIASAKRLIEVRHCWCSSNKIAEISVPAWPIPIHQTKLTIAKPQPMGILMPQIPTPLVSNRPIIKLSSINSENDIARPNSQPGR